MNGRAAALAAAPAAAGPAGRSDPTASPRPPAGLAHAIDAALPQTQCTRCGYPDCRSYAEAIATDGVPINQCPPGGAEGIARLAALTGRAALPLNPVHGIEGPRQIAVIDEAWCIGCTLCLKACPVDSIIGGSKMMHTVVDAQCTGCERCLPACPVDCISMRPAESPATGWAAWSPAQADEARSRYRFHRFREARDAVEQAARLAAATAGGSDDTVEASAGGEGPGATEVDRRAVIQAALARARARAARGGERERERGAGADAAAEAGADAGPPTASPAGN